MNPVQELLLKLATHNLKITSHNGKFVHLAGNYTIEVEREQLFKLLQDKQFIAPFDDLDELCQFIKMDIQLNAENWT